MNSTPASISHQAPLSYLDDDNDDMHLEISDDYMDCAKDFLQFASTLDVHLPNEEPATDGDILEGSDADSDAEVDVSDEALNNLEELVLAFLTQLNDALPDAYSHPNIKKGSGKKVMLQLADRSKPSSEEHISIRTLTFPKHCKGPSARPLAQLLGVVNLVHEAIVNDVPVTKRDMYYQDVLLFRSQPTVDRLVDDLAATFQVTREDLNVRASAKGLMCGFGLTVHMKSGDAVKIMDSEASLIPPAEDIEGFEVEEDLAWVLVVEKEAVFQTLCRSKFATHNALPGPGMIVTGKGYPDVATRQLVKTLSDNLPSRVPIVALVDGDAYGIDILSVYKHGSTRMQHENENLAAARVEWVGLWASELAGLGIDKDVLLPITRHDEKKARTMLKRANLPTQWRKELQYMLFSRRKAEIEVLSASRPATNAFADLGPGPTGAASHESDPIREEGITGAPLVRYLVAKISSACMKTTQIAS